MNQNKTTGKKLFGHPTGLFILVFTEMWERFSYYGMRAILVLYLVAETHDKNPGLSWTNKEALALYGWYTMAVYIACIPGGFIADRFLGQKKSVFLGGILLVIGHSILTIDQISFFYTGLVFIVMGVGMLKPNISVMVGDLYAKGDIRREKGFTIFYISINVGAFLSALVVGYIAERYGWHYGFGFAGIGMFLGLLQYILGRKHLVAVGNLPEFRRQGGKPSTKLLTKIEKDRIIVLLISFLLVIIFWGAFEQAGGLLNLYASEKTDRYLMGFEVPASWFQSLNAMFIILLGTAITSFWIKRKLKGLIATSLFQMILGLIIMGSGFLFMGAASIQYEHRGDSAMYWLVLAYLFHTVGEMCLSPVILSYITKLAPVKYISLMMGIYFATTGIGNKLAGLLGEFSESVGEFNIFMNITIFCVVFGCLMLLFRRKLEHLTHNAEQIKI